MQCNGEKFTFATLLVHAHFSWADSVALPFVICTKRTSSWGNVYYPLEDGDRQRRLQHGRRLVGKSESQSMYVNTKKTYVIATTTTESRGISFHDHSSFNSLKDQRNTLSSTTGSNAPTQCTLSLDDQRSMRDLVGRPIYYVWMIIGWVCYSPCTLNPRYRRRETTTDAAALWRLTFSLSLIGQLQFLWLTIAQLAHSNRLITHLKISFFLSDYYMQIYHLHSICISFWNASLGHWYINESLQGYPFLERCRWRLGRKTLEMCLNLSQFFPKPCSRKSQIYSNKFYICWHFTWIFGAGPSKLSTIL